MILCYSRDIIGFKAQQHAEASPVLEYSHIRMFSYSLIGCKNCSSTITLHPTIFNNLSLNDRLLTSLHNHNLPYNHSILCFIRMIRTLALLAVFLASTSDAFRMTCKQPRGGSSLQMSIKSVKAREIIDSRGAPAFSS